MVPVSSFQSELRRRGGGGGEIILVFIVTAELTVNCFDTPTQTAVLTQNFLCIHEVFFIKCLLLFRRFKTYFCDISNISYIYRLLIFPSRVADVKYIRISDIIIFSKADHKRHNFY